jgi:hypothetical protein
MINLSHFQKFALENGLTLDPEFPGAPYPARQPPPVDSNIPRPPLLPENEGIQLPDRGIFPLEKVPLIMREYAQELASTHQLPVELPALCMIATLSGALGKQWEVVNAIADHKTRGNLLLVLSLPPGSGKSVSNRIARPMQQVEDERAQNWAEISHPRVTSEMQALDAEIQRLKRPKKDAVIDRGELTRKLTQFEKLKREASYSPALITGNATTSGLASELARVEKETLWAFSAEAGEVIRVMLGVFRKDGTDMDLWLSGYSGEGYKQVRAGAIGGTTIRLSDPCISALLMVQPCVLEEILKNSSARDRGLLARLLAVSIDADLPFDDGVRRRVCPQIERRWEGLVRNVLRLRFDLTSPRELRCPEESARVFRDFYNTTTHLWGNGKYADLRNELVRWRENAIRLSVVLQAAKNPDSLELEPEAARDAVALIRWIGIGSLEFASVGRTDRLLDRVTKLEKVLSAGGGTRLASDLQKRNGFTLAEVRQLVEVFPRRVSIESTDVREGGGRPGHIVRLLPQTG